MPSASATAIRRASASASIMVPVGLAGLATTTPASGVCAVRGDQRLGRQRPARLGGGLDQHRLAAERGEDVPVGRIAGIGQRHPVARLEQRQERQDEAARGAGGDHHARRVEREVVGVGVMAGDSRPQATGCRASRYSRCGHARARPAPPQSRSPARAPPAGPPPCARRGRPWPRARRRRHHVHDHERRHIAAFGGRQQVFCRLKHRYRPVWALPPPRCCRIPRGLLARMRFS